MEITVYRKYDGYTYKGVVTGQTKATLNIQLPGYTRPIRFRRLRHDRSKLCDEGQFRGLYCYFD